MSHSVPTTTETDVDHLLAVVSNRRRRRIVRCLRHGGTLRVEELAALVASAEEDATAPGDGVAVERVRVDLRHRHLPLLDDAGLLRFADDGATVVASDLGNRVADWLVRVVSEVPEAAAEAT